MHSLFFSCTMFNAIVCLRVQVHVFVCITFLVHRKTQLGLTEKDCVNPGIRRKNPHPGSSIKLKRVLQIIRVTTSALRC